MPTFEPSGPLRRRPGRVAPLIAALAALAALPCGGTEATSPSLIEKLPDGRATHAGPDSIYFPASSALLDEEARKVLQRHVSRLELNPALNVTLVAHTDELGSTALEIARGQDRLNVVQRILEEARISRWRIRTVNLGSEIAPAEDCNDDNCRRQRRRIDFLFHR